MKHIRLIASFLVIALLVIPLTRCKPKTVDANAEFWVSVDGGNEWTKSGPYVFPLDSSVYVKLKVRVYTNSNTESYPSVSLTIPNIEAVDAYIVDGPKVIPTIYVSNAIYTFKTRAVKNNTKDTELVVEFIPYSKTRVNMAVEFDDSVYSAYDRTFEIKFE
jgi:hypothetical protein